MKMLGIIALHLHSPVNLMTSLTAKLCFSRHKIIHWQFKSLGFLCFSNNSTMFSSWQKLTSCCYSLKFSAISFFWINFPLLSWVASSGISESSEVAGIWWLWLLSYWDQHQLRWDCSRHSEIHRGLSVICSAHAAGRTTLHTGYLDGHKSGIKEILGEQKWD